MVIESQHSLNLQVYQGPAEDSPGARAAGQAAGYYTPMVESLDQPGSIRADVDRYRRVQREVNTRTEQMERERNPTRESDALHDLPHESRDSLFRPHRA